MKNKILLLSILAIALIVLFGVQLIIVQAARAGKFDNADFFAPDYNNGETETFGIGETRAFNYSCHCVNQSGKSSCNGYIRLQIDAGTGFIDEKSDICNIGELETCSVNHAKTFDAVGIYKFRVFCDENSGTDFTQPSNEYVTLTVEESCVLGEMRYCPLQDGVCAGFYEICTFEGTWPGCDYSSIPNYGAEAIFDCDGLDNECDGFVDDIDNDGDGSGPCGGLGIVNELLISGLNDDYGRIDIFGYDPVSQNYNPLWFSVTPGMAEGSLAGGEIGDLTHDGVNDFIVHKYDGSNHYLEVWTYDLGLKEWYRVWSANKAAYIGDIGDFDNDGFEELVFTDTVTDAIEVWGNDVVNATTFSQEAIVKQCSNAKHHGAAGDLNNNGILEIIFQCGPSDNIEIWEHNMISDQYELLDSIAPPLTRGGTNGMSINDMECDGDVNRDGVNDCVFCGSSGASHVFTYKNGNYIIDYNTPKTPSDISYTRTCSIGDITNDGFVDWFDGSMDGIRAFSYQDGSYQEIWESSDIFYDNGAIGSSFVGDSDNDNKEEFLHGPTTSEDEIVMLWETNLIGATDFDNTFTWSHGICGADIIVGNLNPYNDDTGVDCNDNNASIYPGAVDICGDAIDQDCSGSDAVCECIDNDLDNYYGHDPAHCPIGNDCNDNDASINPGVAEVCGDGIDNNCNDEVDEGCGPICGDGYCEGAAAGEDCHSCSTDCPSGSRGVCCGDGKCDSRKGETSSFCPVDCQ